MYTSGWFIESTQNNENMNNCQQICTDSEVCDGYNEQNKKCQFFPEQTILFEETAKKFHEEFKANLNQEFHLRKQYNIKYWRKISHPKVAVENPIKDVSNKLLDESNKFTNWIGRKLHNIKT